MPIMPRKPTLKDPETEVAMARIKRYCDRANVCLATLSRQAGVSQPALYRFVHGERKSVTKTARRVLTHIDNKHKQHNSHGGENRSEGCRIIDDAVNSVWDGRIQTAELLAALIRAIKPVLLAAEAVGNTLPHERV